MTPDTGQLATAVFEAGPNGGVDFEARMIMIGELARTIQALEASALDTEDEEELVPGDLVKPGEIEVEFYFFGQALPLPGSKSILTVTYPLAEDQSSAASWTASGFFTSTSQPSAQLNNLMKAKAKFQLDGRETKFTFTPAVASAP